MPASSNKNIKQKIYHRSEKQEIEFLKKEKGDLDTIQKLMREEIIKWAK